MSDDAPSRNDFDIAIACALEHESSAVRAIFDKTWEPYRALNDTNCYTRGKIGNHNVVLLYLPGMGGRTAATATAHLLHSFPFVRVVLVVGICGGAPLGENKKMLNLGDVVVSDSVVPYTYVRRYPDRSKRKDTLLDSLARPNEELRAFLHMMKTIPERKLLLQRTQSHLDVMLAEEDYAEFRKPTMATQELFHASYRHKHQRPGECDACDRCIQERDEVCEIALTASCVELGCDRKNAEMRPVTLPAIHFGTVASGDQVMKSAIDRDITVREDHAIAFEMEGAGAWDNISTIIIKSVCDFADSHKNKGWQNYAAAVAACCTKALLQAWMPAGSTTRPPTDVISNIVRPQPSSTVPFSRDPDFMDRDGVLHAVDARCSLSAGRGALVGLGGVGKSQFAIEYSWIIRERSPQTWVFWVHASSSARFEQSFREIADRADLPGRDNSNHVLQTVYSWLCDPKSGSWMIILDNADDASVLFENQEENSSNSNISSSRGFRKLATLLPQAPHGSVLVTSRDKDVAYRLVGDYRHIIDVQPMKEGDAILLLERKLVGDFDPSAAKELVSELDGMPLAIAQAAAYITQRGPRGSIKRYLQSFRNSDQKKASLLNRDAGDLRRDEEASNSVFITLHITFNHILENEFSASEMFSIMCLFNRQGIPKSALYDVRRDEQNESRKKDDHEQTEASNFIGSDSDSVTDRVDDDLDVLSRYNIISTSFDGEFFDMHRLVHLALRNWLEINDRLEFWRCKYANLLSQIFPPLSIYTGPPLRSRILYPHALSLLTQRPNAREPLLQWSVAASNVALYALNVGDYRVAENALQLALQVKRDILGAEHDTILEILEALAVVLRLGGQLDNAERISRQVLEMRKNLQGEKHERTLRSAVNLARVLIERGAYEKAEEIVRAVLEEQYKIYGSTSSEVMPTLDALAFILHVRDQYREAEDIFRQMLAKAKVMSKKNDVYTLQLLSRLATTVVAQGRYAEAEKILRDAAEGSKMLDDDHVDALKFKTRLASVLREQGKFQEAEDMARTARQRLGKTLGEKHSTTLENVLTIAICLAQQGKYEAAEPYYRCAIDGYEETLGGKHPITLRSLLYFAEVLPLSGKSFEAEKLCQRVLSEESKTFGEEHSLALRALSQLSIILKSQRSYLEAEKMSRKVLEGHMKLVGEAHPVTFRTMTILASILAADGKDFEEAEKLSRRAQEGFTEMLGQDHPHTIESSTALAEVLQLQGHQYEAEMKCRTVLESSKRTLGTEHPSTLARALLLARILTDLGQREEAGELYEWVLKVSEDIHSEIHADALKAMRSLARELH